MSFTISQTPSSINLYLYPDGSTSTQLISSGTANYEMVNENWDSPDDGDYVYTTNTSSQKDWYSLPDHTTETGTINYVRVIARAKSNSYTQSSNGEYVLWTGDGSNTDEGVNQAPLTTSYNKYYETFITAPDGGSWTWADIDNLLLCVECSSPTIVGSSAEFIVRPTGDSSIEFTKSTHDYNYECVDETEANGSTDYVYSTADKDANDYDDYTCTNHTAESGTITKVGVYVNLARTGAVGNGYFNYGISLGGSRYLSSEYITASDTWINKSKSWSSSPTDDITPFTWIDIDNMLLSIQGHGYSGN